MATPAEWKASLRAMLNEQGETVQLRRYSGTNGSRTFVDTPVTARVKGYGSRELIGTAITQDDRRVIVHADDVAALLPLSTSDKVVVRNRECDIKGFDDDTRRFQGVLIGIDLQVAG